MLRPIHAEQRKVRYLHLKVDGTGTASITQGSSEATLTDNDTGDYTLTFATAGQRILGVMFSPLTKVYHQLSSATKSAVRVLTFNDAGSATDADFFLTVALSDTEDEL